MQTSLRQNIVILLTLAVELALLCVVLVVLMLGLLGFFLPILPGVLFIGAGVALYGFLLHDKRSYATKAIHRHLDGWARRFVPERLRRHSSRVRHWLGWPSRTISATDAVIPYTLALIGLDALLVALCGFGLLTVAALSPWMPNPVLWSFFSPILVLLLVAECSVIAWFRFGQLLGERVAHGVVAAATAVVFASVLPWLGILAVATTVVGLSGLQLHPAGILAVLVVMYSIVLSVAFKVLSVTIGGLTRH